jgi:alginate O-acetyltransferase complex protein AlgJ
MKAARPKITIAATSRSQEIDKRGFGDITALLAPTHLVIQGWVVGKTAAASYLEALDGEKVIARVPIDQRRPDVAEARPDLEGAGSSGFRFDIEPKKPGAGRLVVRVAFEDGTEASLGSVQVEVEESLRSKLRGNLSGRRRRNGGRVGWKTQVQEESFKVLQGRGNWLFLQNDSNDVIGQHTGRVTLGEDARRQWAAVLARRRAAARTENATWLLAVVPDKEAVYPEYLPAGVEPSPRRPIHDLLEIAQHAQAPTLYLLDALRAAKPTADLFPKTDTHWNYRGAFVGYRAICDRLQQEGIGLDVLDGAAIEWESETVQGDLGSKLREPAESARLIPKMPPVRSSLVYDNEVNNHGRVKIFEISNSDAPTCVLFGESFAEGLLVFLRESFSRLVFVHTSMFVDAIVEREQPDVVLSIPIERFLLRVPDDTDALMKLEGTARAKGGELPWPSEQFEVR